MPHCQCFVRDILMKRHFIKARGIQIYQYIFKLLTSTKCLLIKIARTKYCQCDMSLTGCGNSAQKKIISPSNHEGHADPYKKALKSREKKKVLVGWQKMCDRGKKSTLKTLLSSLNICYCPCFSIFCPSLFQLFFSSLTHVKPLRIHGIKDTFR